VRSGQRLRNQPREIDQVLAVAKDPHPKTSTRQAPSQGAQAFVLYFDSHVIVEFSESGNASYVYERAKFETQFGRELRFGGIPNHSALKSKSAAHGRILHLGDWETKAEDDLQELGIRPSG